MQMKKKTYLIQMQFNDTPEHAGLKLMGTVAFSYIFVTLYAWFGLTSMNIMKLLDSIWFAPEDFILGSSR